jgi:thiol-disulfide isomerase/thioredoxin
MKKFNFTILVIVVIAIVTAGFLYNRYRVPPALHMPSIELTDLSGHRVSLQDYDGTPLFISFFATWCGPCMKELPELADLQDKLSDEKLKIICICDDPIDKLLPLQQKFGNKLIILHSGSKFHDIGVYTYPTNYIYNSSGNKVYQKVNPENWENDDVIEKVRQLLQ